MGIGSSRRFHDPASTQDNDMSSQLRSPLFRLTRELRDEIYTQCTYETSGYHHVFDFRGLGQIHAPSEEAPSIPLKATCQRIAQEIRGVGL
jgi:hypothetical protein